MSAPKHRFADLRPPDKLILLTALLVPVLNTLLFGTGMLLSSYYGMNSEALTALSSILGVVFQVVRAAALSCTLLTLCFYAGKTGFAHTFPPLALAVLSALLTTAAGLGVYALLLGLGLTDSSEMLSFSSRFLPYMFSALGDLLVLALIEAACVLICALVCAQRGRTGILTLGSHFTVTFFILIGAYTLLTMYEPLKTALNYSSEMNFFLVCILPFLYKLLYGGVMALAGVWFRKAIGKFYKESDGVGLEEL